MRSHSQPGPLLPIGRLPRDSASATIQDAAIEILIARTRGLPLGSLLANRERLIDLYFFEGDAVGQRAAVRPKDGPPIGRIAQSCNGIIGIRRKVEAGASPCLRCGRPVAALVGRLRGGILRKSGLVLRVLRSAGLGPGLCAGILRKPRLVLGELFRAALAAWLREWLRYAGKGQKRKAQEKQARAWTIGTSDMPWPGLRPFSFNRGMSDLVFLIRRNHMLRSLSDTTNWLLASGPKRGVLRYSSGSVGAKTNPAPAPQIPGRDICLVSLPVLALYTHAGSQRPIAKTNSGERCFRRLVKTPPVRQ